MKRDFQTTSEQSSSPTPLSPFDTRFFRRRKKKLKHIAKLKKKKKKRNRQHKRKLWRNEKQARSEKLFATLKTVVALHSNMTHVHALNFLSPRDQWKLWKVSRFAVKICKFPPNWIIVAFFLPMERTLHWSVILAHMCVCVCVWMCIGVKMDFLHNFFFSRFYEFIFFLIAKC